MGKIIDALLDTFSSEERRAREQLARAFRESPKFQKALERVKNLAGGYYRGERRGRTLGEWVTSEADANELLSPSLTDLRNDSNDLYTNNGLAAGAVNTFVTNSAVLTLSPNVDFEALGQTAEWADEWNANAEREWLLFVKDCDLLRQSNWHELCQIVMRSRLISGDVFVNLPMIRRKGVTYRTCLNLIEGQRVSNPNMAPDKPSLIMGVELDNNGAPVRYHYSTGGQYGTVKAWNTLNAYDANGERQVLHVHRKHRPNQLRGVPFLAPVIELIKKIDTFTQAELDAACINAFFTVFIKKRAPGSGTSPFDAVTNMGAETGATSSDKDIKLGAGTIVELFPDEEGVDLADPKRPNANFEAFFKAISGEIAMGLNIPREVLMKAFDASYSASRGAVIEALKAFREEQESQIADFCQPIYEAFMYEAVLSGRIEAPGFLDDPLARMAYCSAEWIGQEQAELNPLDSVNAAEKRIALGISNEIIETSARGQNYAKVQRGAQRAQRMRGADARTDAAGQTGGQP